MPTPSDILLVPMTLKSWVFNQNVSTGNLGIRRWQNDYKNLPNFGSVEPGSLSTSASPGVYVRWELPLGIRHGLRNAGDTQVTFPAVPNRWLVIRLYGPLNSRSALAWVVESDFLGTDLSQGGAPFPDAKTGSQVLLGRAVPLQQWPDSLSKQASNYLGALTAVANGDVSFASYQPHNSNIFSFYDPVPDIKDDGSTLSYSVMGWYDDVSQDPVSLLQAFMQAEQQKNPDKASAKILSDGLAKMSHDYFWSLNSRQPLSNFQSVLCHGTSVGINYFNPNPNPNGSSAPSPNPGTLQLAIGQTGIEALNALISGTNAVIPQPLLDAFHFGLLKDLENMDVEEQLREEQHQAGFGKEQGGTHWEIVAATSTASSVEETAPDTLPSAIITALNALNAQQSNLDFQNRLLKSWQTELYHLWWKSGFASHSSEEFFKPANGSIVKDLSNAIDSSDPNNQNSFLVQVKAQQDTVAQLQASVESAVINLSAQLAKLSPAQILKAKPLEPFWHPVDPVILITGVASPGLVNNKNLNCRDQGEVLSQVNFTLNGKTQSQSVSSLKLPIISFGALPTNLQSAVKGLWQEFMLLDAVLSQTGSKNIITIQNGQQLPDFGLSAWTTQPWDPLFIEWSVDWYDIPPAIWAFEKNALYQVQSPPTGLKALPPQPSGRVFLGPQASFSFKSKLLLLVEQHGDFISKNFPDINMSELIDAINGWDVLSQRLNGFNAQLAMQDGTINRIPNAKLSTELAYSKALGTEVRRASSAAVPHSSDDALPPFRPIRQGQCYIQTLNVIDAFGQALGIFGTDTANPGIFIYQSLQPNDPKNVVTSAPYTIQLGPRIVQGTRLSQDWIDAQDDSKGLSLNIEAQPICGWILPNYIDVGLQVYDPEGLWLGELRQGVAPNSQGNLSLIWDPAPNGADSLTTLTQSYPHLGNMLSNLQSQELSAYQALLDVMQQALSLNVPTTTAHLNYYSAYVGRPLALVRSQCLFEFNRLCYKDQGWQYTAKVVGNWPAQWPSFNASANVIQAQATSDTKFAGNFNLYFGNPNKSQDGLIGYFQGTNYSRLYSVYPPLSNNYLSQITGQELSLSLSLDATGKPAQVYTTLLLDPMFSVNIYTDILPVKTLTVPKQLIDKALKKMQMNFRVGPLLLAEPTLMSVEGEDEDEDVQQSMVSMPKPSLGNWSWVTKKLEHNPEMVINQNFRITSSGSNAHFEEKGYTLTEGFLQSTVLATLQALSTQNQVILKEIARLSSLLATQKVLPNNSSSSSSSSTATLVRSTKPTMFTPAALLAKTGFDVRQKVLQEKIVLLTRLRLQLQALSNKLQSEPVTEVFYQREIAAFRAQLSELGIPITPALMPETTEEKNPSATSSVPLTSKKMGRK